METAIHLLLARIQESCKSVAILKQRTDWKYPFCALLSVVSKLCSLCSSISRANSASLSVQRKISNIRFRKSWERAVFWILIMVLADLVETFTAVISPVNGTECKLIAGTGLDLLQCCVISRQQFEMFIISSCFKCFNLNQISFYLLFLSQSKIQFRAKSFVQRRPGDAFLHIRLLLTHFLFSKQGGDSAAPGESLWTLQPWTTMIKACILQPYVFCNTSPASSDQNMYNL